MNINDVLFSPHAWGCSGRGRGAQGRGGVFPTRVGMFRAMSLLCRVEACFPHTRGDVPQYNVGLTDDEMFSPHAWGCSCRPATKPMPTLVFPTRVGMFRNGLIKPARAFGFPHTRGDVPVYLSTYIDQIEFSPHAWGCSANGIAIKCAYTVFPTRVGMFRAF